MRFKLPNNAGADRSISVIYCDANSLPKMLVEHKMLCSVSGCRYTGIDVVPRKMGNKEELVEIFTVNCMSLMMNFRNDRLLSTDDTSCSNLLSETKAGRSCLLAA